MKKFLGSLVITIMLVGLFTSFPVGAAEEEPPPANGVIIND